MEDNINKQLEIQGKISAIVKERQSQISDLKSYFNAKNKTLYKEVILISENLNLFEELMSKSEYRLRVENLYSLASSFGKVLDLNNSVKTVLLGLKIFEEHEAYMKQNVPNLNNQNQNKSFIYKMFEKNDSLPLIKNEMIKNKFLQNPKTQVTDANYIALRDFYQALYRNDGNFWTDFNKYLNFQMDPKQKNKENQFKLEEFSQKMLKLYQGSVVNYSKFYSRCQPSFDMDFPSVVLAACDIFFMFYNKFMDKICYQQQLFEYLLKLDNLIYVRKSRFIIFPLFTAFNLIETFY